MNDPPPPAAPQARGEGALSPLSGSYLLIVVAQPHVEQHKDTILSRISKGKLNMSVCEGVCVLRASWYGSWGWGAPAGAGPRPINAVCHVRRRRRHPGRHQLIAAALLSLTLLLSPITCYFAHLRCTSFQV